MAADKPTFSLLIRLLRILNVLIKEFYSCLVRSGEGEGEGRGGESGRGSIGRGGEGKGGEGRGREGRGSGECRKALSANFV